MEAVTRGGMCGDQQLSMGNRTFAAQDIDERRQKQLLPSWVQMGFYLIEKNGQTVGGFFFSKLCGFTMFEQCPNQ